MKDDSGKEMNNPLQKAAFLSQMIVSLEQSADKLEEHYMKENHEQFKITREFILKIQKRKSL